MKNILVKAVITEKSNKLSEAKGVYTFRVDRKANKLEIKKSVEGFYNVKVAQVNTSIVPGKKRARNTKSGLLKGIKSGYKKAFVTLAQGETINIYETL